MAAIALCGLFAVTAGVFLAWRGSQWGLNALLYDNKAFAIQEIDVQTDGVIALDQLRRWTGVRMLKVPHLLLLADEARATRAQK